MASNLIHNTFAFLVPITQLTSLIIPEIFFRSNLRRILTVLVIWVMAADAIYFVKLPNPKVGYMVGLLLAWFSIRSIVLILAYSPSAEFSRLEGKDNPQKIRQSPNFPPHFAISRVWWAADVLSNFRAVGWNYGIVPAKMSPSSGESASYCEVCGSETLTLYRSIIRFLSNLLWIHICQTWAFPYIKQGIPMMSKSLGYGLWLGWLMRRSAQMLFSITAAFSVVDSMYCFWSIIHAVSKRNNGLHHPFWTNPSPWGSLNSIGTNGLAGFWNDVWHAYFRLGFVKASGYVAMQLFRLKPTAKTRFMRLWIAFGFSAYMHMCGSWMMSHHGNPVYGQFMFFVLQAIGISVQLTTRQMLDHAICHNKTVRTFGNYFFCFIWLFWTTPYLTDDMIMGGFWDRNKQQI